MLFLNRQNQKAKLTIMNFHVLLPVIIFASVIFLNNIIFQNPTDVNAATYTASMSTSGNITIELSTQGNGTAIGTDNLIITSTCPRGYNVTIQGPSDTNLYLNGDNSNNATGTYIAHSSGTINNPATITGNNLGTWGYSTTSSTSSGTFIGLTNTVTPLISKNSASASGGDNIPVYYGASAPTNLAPGSYRMTGTSAIVYYLTTSEDCFSYQVSFNANGGTGTMQTQRIYEGIATPLTANSFTPPSGSRFKEWNTSYDGTGTSYIDEESVTDIATVGTTLPLYAIWEPVSFLYDKVADQAKGTQTVADLRAVITNSNSGVYEYDSATFGTASDASNDYTIYYYRGILDSNLNNNTSTYGSNGDGTLYPNYVKLGDTCWRIFRTTGSGGVKMIYNGSYSSGTTANSCANATTNAQVSSITFGSQGTSAHTDWQKNINRAGYTYNAAMDDITTTTSTDTVLGSNLNYSTTNTTDSYIKDYLENTWFSSINGISAYESMLEPSAGYCNDRSAYSDSSGTTTMTNVVPYATSGNYTYFGSYARHRVANKTITLTCPRGTVDLYTTSSATDGNNQLNKPVALLTTDEAALSGNGYGGRTSATNYSSNYSYSSFLRSGTDFWLLSSRYRYNTGDVRGYAVLAEGYLSGNHLYDAHGLRPVISLKSGTIISSGTGIATDPWVVDAP